MGAHGGSKGIAIWSFNMSLGPYPSLEMHKHCTFLVKYTYMPHLTLLVAPQGFKAL